MKITNFNDLRDELLRREDAASGDLNVAQASTAIRHIFEIISEMEGEDATLLVEKLVGQYKKTEFREHLEDSDKGRAKVVFRKLKNDE